MMIITSFLAILAALFLFHVLVLAGRLPADLVWGGRVQTRAGLIALEGFALVLLLGMAAVGMIKAGWLQAPASISTVDYILWGISAFFALSTVGSLAGRQRFERVFLAPLAFILMLLSMALALLDTAG